jgi:hypothetical protein
MAIAIESSAAGGMHIHHGENLSYLDKVDAGLQNKV